MKKLLSWLLIISLSLAMTACGTGNEKANGNDEKQKKEVKEDQKAEKKADDGEMIEIRLLTRMAGTSKQAEIFRDVLAEFEAKHEDVKVIDESQGDESSFNNKLKTDIASGTLPNIFRIQGVANLGEYIKNGLLMNMAPVIDEDANWSAGLTEGAVKYYEVPGFEGTYAVPMESGIISVFYNEAVFEKAGIDHFPETWSELRDAVEKLKAVNVVPFALGAKTTYMAGHLHNQIVYKWLGVEAAKKLGSRQMKWTDPEVVETLAYVKELYDLGAFPEGVAGVSDDIVLTQFLKGEAGMMITGPWNIGKFTNPEETEYVGKIKIAKFPHFADKPEFKDHDMQIISPYMVSGKLTGKEKEYTLELIKMLTSKEVAKRFAEEAQFIMPRNDIEVDPDKVSDLFKEVVSLSGTSTGIAVDVFDYDPLASMQDRTRNSIVSLFVGATPEQAAEEIQEEIDRNSK